MTTAVTGLLDEAATTRPAAPAVVFAGRTVSYAQLRDHADRLAGALAVAGVQPGDRVGIVLPNCTQHVIALFAVLRLGAVAVLVDPLAEADELSGALEDATSVICLDHVLPSVQAVRGELSLRHVVVTTLPDYYPVLSRLRLRLPASASRRQRGDLVASVDLPADTVRFGAAVKSGSPAPQAPVHAADVAVVVRSAGTTGPPHAVALSHGNLVANAEQMRAVLADGDRVGAASTLGVLPLFHVFGLSLGLFATVRAGGKLVLLPRFEPSLVFAAVEAEKPSVFPAVPPMFQSLLSAPDVLRRDLRSIRTCVSVGMRLSTETVERFERVTGARMLEAYGSTETGITHCNPMTGRRLGTVGTALADTEARILDVKDPERVAGPGERGELCVRGPQVASADWYATGELASVDDDGFARVFGRKVDAFVAGLARVHPVEVEELISALPGVADACVIGRRQGRKVEMTAYVVVYPDTDIDADAIRRHLADKLPATRVPSVIELRARLPRSVLGQPLRREL